MKDSAKKRHEERNKSLENWFKRLAVINLCLLGTMSAIVTLIIVLKYIYNLFYGVSEVRYDDFIREWMKFLIPFLLGFSLPSINTMKKYLNIK